MGDRRAMFMRDSADAASARREARDDRASHADRAPVLVQHPAARPIIRSRPSPGDADGIAGTVFQITEEELRNADTYEVAAYKRIAVTPRSGARASVYVDPRYAPAS